MNETEIINFLNTTGIKLVTTQITDDKQFMLTFIVSAFGALFGIYYIYNLLVPYYSLLYAKVVLWNIKRKTGRRILFIRHTSRGIFGGSMIDTNTLLNIQDAILSFKGKEFDLILHTPGGEIFSATAISRILKRYPNKIRAIIPVYAMSGGTLLALSCNEIVMSNIACLGPVDPQLGSLFSYGSARAWDRIIKFKGKKAEDSSISMAMMGKQYTNAIKELLNETIDFNLSSLQKKKLIEFLTNGKIEHAHNLTPELLNSFGIKTKEFNLEDKYSRLLMKIILNSSFEGVIKI